MVAWVKGTLKPSINVKLGNPTTNIYWMLLKQQIEPSEVKARGTSLSTDLAKLEIAANFSQPQKKSLPMWKELFLLTSVSCYGKIRNGARICYEKGKVTC